MWLLGVMACLQQGSVIWFGQRVLWQVHASAPVYLSSQEAGSLFLVLVLSISTNSAPAQP